MISKEEYESYDNHPEHGRRKGNDSLCFLCKKLIKKMRINSG